MQPKRLQIPLDDETIAAYEEYAAVMDTTVPKALNAILKQSLPGIRKITAALLEVKEARSEAVDSMVDIVDKLREDLVQQRIK